MFKSKKLVGNFEDFWSKFQSFGKILVFKLNIRTRFIILLNFLVEIGSNFGKISQNAKSKDHN